MNISYRLSVLDDIALYSLLDPAIIPTGVPGHPAVTQSKYRLFFILFSQPIGLRNSRFPILFLSFQLVQPPGP